VKEGTRKGREDGSEMEREALVSESLNSRGPGLKASFVVEPSRNRVGVCICDERSESAGRRVVG